MKTQFFTTYIILILLLTSSAGCNKDGCDEGIVELSATPNPVTAVFEGEVAIWAFSMVFTNHTCESLTLGQICEKFYDTDTRYTNQRIYKEWCGAGRAVPTGESYTSSRYARTNQAHSGKYDLTITATDRLGKEYVTNVTIILL